MRYFATRLNGDGTETPLAWDLPVSGGVLQAAINGSGGLDGKISPEVPRLTGGGEPIFVPWSTALYAEDNGIRGGGILTDLTADGPALSLTCKGFSGYLDGMPFTDEFKTIQEDPMNVVRYIWGHAQGKKRGNLGLKLDATKSKVKIGTAGTGSSSDSGPYTLSWWDTDDLGKEVDDLAASTPFEYREKHSWSGESLVHRLELGYPRLGARRSNLRFVVGENITDILKLDWDGDAYSDEVYLLGAGEGRKMVRGLGQRSSTRLRRPSTVRDKTVTAATRANTLASNRVKATLGDEDFDEVIVRDHPNARIGSWDVGDEVFIQSRGDWHDKLGLWVRVLSQAYDVDKGTVTLRCQRADKQD